MFHRKGFWITLMIILLAAACGGGTYYYTQVYLPGQQPAEPALKTAKVRRGAAGPADPGRFGFSQQRADL